MLTTVMAERGYIGSIGCDNGYAVDLHGSLHVASHSATTGMMTGTNTKLTAAVEAYFTDLGRVRASGGATGERSSYGRSPIC